MKKNTIRVFFFFFLAIGLFFYNTNLTKAADPLAKITSITPDPVDTTKVVITGTINAEGGTILYDNLYNPVVLYGPAGDSGKPDIKSLKSVSCFRSNPTPGPTFCQFDRNSDNSGVFTATISGLVEGGDYVAIPYSADNNSNRYPIGESEGEPFSIKGIAHPIVTFGSTTPVGKNGQEITVNIKNLSAPATGYIELGTATQIEKTAKYTCTTNGKVSDKKTVSATTGDSSKSITVIFNDLEDGVYCIRPMVVALPYDLAVAEGHERDRAGFWTAKGALFGIGVKIDPNATNDPGANALGCKYEKDNKSYCLLAPLPGVGDTTGKLDVTKGIGNYFNMIIKLVMGIIGVLAVLMVVVGGIEYMSTVNLGEKEGARARITSAILGLLLALSAYLILKTINPDLVNVNIGVPEGTIVQEEEFSETSTSGSGVSISKSQVTIAIPGSVSDMAKQLLNNSNVSFSGYANNAAKKDLQAMADGKQIIRQDGSKGPPLSEKMLAGLLSMAKTMPIKIGVLESAHHNSGPNGHWGGRGVDFQIVHGGGKPAKNTKANLDYDKKLMEACVAGGAIPTQVFGPCTDDFSYTSSLKLCPYTQFNSNIDHSNHVHCGW
jgi:hypothetical protein